MEPEKKIHIIKISRSTSRLLIDMSIVGCVLFGMAITGNGLPMLGLSFILLRRLGGAIYDEDHGAD